MKAIIINEFGNTDLLKEVDIPTPTPGENEVLTQTTADAHLAVETGKTKGKVVVTI